MVEKPAFNSLLLGRFPTLLLCQDVDTCVFAYNTAVQESSHFSPFEVMFGRKATLPIDLNIDQRQPEDKVVVNLELSVSGLENFTAHQQEIIQQTKVNIQQAQQKQKEAYDRKHAHPDAFQVGAYVLKKDFLRKKRANGKLDARYLGPYIITKKLGKGLYALKLAASHTHTIDRVNGAHLKPNK